MPEAKPGDSQIVSVRLPHELVRRLDRYLDWHERSRRRPSSRNAAIRQALSLWLDDQEQLAGYLLNNLGMTARAQASCHGRGKRA